MSEKKKVTCAVVPAAGRGTRFLPATKAIPKEMLILVDKPAIQYVAEEATDAGITDFLIITSSSKHAIEDHFDACPELETALVNSGKTAELAAINSYQQLARMHTVRQGHPKGLGHAVLQAKTHVGDNPFAVMLPDDLMHPEDPLLKKMIAVQEKLGGSVVALLEVTPEQATAYGSADVSVVDLAELELDTIPGICEGDVYKLNDVVEKPALEDVLSNYAAVGRYVFDPKIFEILETLPAGRGGEIQLTDAFRALIDVPVTEGGGVYGLVVKGRRFDTGDKFGYLQAQVELGLEHPVYQADFRAYLEEKLASLNEH
ncbi:nucleotidyl transferase [Gleimia coleocanis DSM 15436]|uniref:UTP--glucose-1-phosphate uridylyltransferase n=1 Tax=Gleimia coleocanis DSM 15436 TaxID=525245 RepID=C0W286_9ACTO|nr:UTP--glucose-1-phosphate uridylyltransferase [Gleimia coleocanis]EEH63300.1 nucleotidyl transferase [Gleimia coleocanis DSM 15436]